MKSILKYTFSIFFFWLFVFFINRLFFVWYQLPIGNRIGLHSDLVSAFYKGYKLDFATAVMYSLLPLLLHVVYFITEIKIFKKIALVLMAVFLVIYAATGIGDAGLYKEWNAKINLQALEHFKNPSEVFETVSIKLQLSFMLMLSLFTIPFYYVYKKITHAHIQLEEQSSFKNRFYKSVTYFLLVTGFGVIIIRGGFTGIPMNQSAAYFSRDVLANDIAVNPFYNILQDLTIKQNIPDESIYKCRSNEEAQNLIADDFKVEKDSTVAILNTNRPNIAIIFLESWSADNVSVLGGIEGCTPQFNALSKEGLLFTKAYSNAYVSDQGIPAVLSAYPSVSRVAIVNQPAKVPSLHCISEDLLPLGYSSSFMFGGDLIYGNLRGYLLEKKFVNLKEDIDYPQHPKGKLGIHDEFMFPEFLKTLNETKSPFLECFFTTSTHMPYDYPSKTNWQSVANDVEKQYTESVHYSDEQMGKFFAEAKKQPWYQNTLFIVVADHSHNTIMQHEAIAPAHHHIPLLFLGGALKPEWKGKTWDKIVSQLDIPSTILHQMKLPTKNYVWSRNMLNPYTPSSAYYVVFGAVGYINDSGSAGSHQQSSFILHSKNLDTTQAIKLNNKATSFQQLIYEDVKNRK